jgi:hypothetical protein
VYNCHQHKEKGRERRRRNVRKEKRKKEEEEGKEQWKGLGFRAFLQVDFLMQRRTKKQCKTSAFFFATRFSNVKKFMVLETGVALPFVFLRGPFFPSKGERKQGRERKYKLSFGRLSEQGERKFY